MVSDRATAIRILGEWESAIRRTDDMIEKISAVFGQIELSPLAEHMDKQNDLHSRLVAELLGGVLGRLSWFQFDNDLGRNAINVTVFGGEVIKVQNIEDLAMVIAADRVEYSVREMEARN